VVIAIAAMLVAIVPSSLGKLREVSQYRDTVRSVVLSLRQARQDAVESGRATVFRADLAERQFGIVGRTPVRLPDSLEMKATVGASAVATSKGQGDILFFPEGGATGGTIELVRKSGAGVRIRVDWLFGQVTQEVAEQ
jgi:general secretion pathway protein H